MQFHEAANIFPMMSPEEFQSLSDDIKVNGLREAVWTYQGAIIDGRNRYQACLNLKIEPIFREWDGKGSLVAFVISQNLHRRHLDSSQKAAAAVEIEKQLAKEAAQRKGGRPRRDEGKPTQKFAGVSGEARQQAAKLTGTNRQYVSDAKKIDRAAPELLKEVRDGNLTIPDAKKVAGLPPETRAKAVQAIKSEPTPKAKQRTAREFTKPKQEPKNYAGEWAEWVLDARIRLGKVRNASFRMGVLENWTESDRDVVLEAVDLLVEDLLSFKNDVLGGLVYDEGTEEGAEGTVN